MYPSPEGSRKGRGGDSETRRAEEDLGPGSGGSAGEEGPGPGLVLEPPRARSWESWLVEKGVSGTASPAGGPPTWPLELSGSVLGRHLVDILGKATPSCLLWRSPFLCQPAQNWSLPRLCRGSTWWSLVLPPAV